MPITPTLQTHDLVLTDYAATPVSLGLMIERDPKTGKPLFGRFPAESLSRQQFESFAESIFPPQYQGFITQKTWHGGFGKQYLTGLGTDNRYLQTFGVDASVKGLEYPAPVPVAMTNSNPTQTGYNMGFEAWTAISAVNYLDNWAYVNVANPPLRLTSPVQAGTYSVAPAAGGQNITLRQPLGVTAVNGSRITFTVYLARDNITDAPTATLRVLDGSDAQLATSGTITLNGAAGVFAQSTLQYTFTGTVANPQLEILLTQTANTVAVADTAAAAWDLTAVTALTPNAIVRPVTFNNSHYFVSDTGVWKRSAGNLVWVGGSPPGITDAFVDATGTYLVLCRGTSLVYWLMRTNEGFVVTSGSGNSAKTQHGCASAGNSYMSRDDTNVYKYSDLLAATASVTYSAGQVGTKITSMVNHLATAYAVKEDGVFYIPTSGTTMTEVAAELNSMFNANTGKNSTSWRGNGAQTLYMPAGGGAAMLAYDAGDVVNVGPDQFAENLSDFTGQIVATASDDQWLYICLDNGTKIEILKGRYEKIDGVTDFRWHPIIEDTYATVGYMHISSITAKRLYYGGGTALPKYIPLPEKYGAPLSDTGLSYNTAVVAYSSWYDLNLSRITKTHLNITLDSTGLNANRTVKVEYQLWESQGTWTELGGTGNGSFNTSPTQTKTFAVNISGRKIQFRRTYTTNDTTVPYGVYQMTVRLALAPQRLNIFTATVRVSHQNKRKNTGERDTEMTYAKVASQLHAWADTQPLLLTYPDGLFTATDGSHDGATEEVKFMEGYPKEIPLQLAESFPMRQDGESLFELAFVSMDRSLT